jgi:hypothetical protein
VRVRVFVFFFLTPSHRLFPAPPLSCPPFLMLWRLEGMLLLIDADSRSHVKSNSSSSTIQRTTMGSACSSSTSGRRMSRYVYPVHSLPDVGSKEKLRSAPQTLLNPFHTVTMPIRDPGFEAKVRQSAKRNL